MTDDEPIRVSFKGPAPTPHKVTTEQVKRLKGSEEVTATDGTRYVMKPGAHGTLSVKGTSDRVARRQSGESPRQFKKRRKAWRRSLEPEFIDDAGNPEPPDLGEQDMGERQG